MSAFGDITVNELRQGLVAIANGDERTVDLAVSAAARLRDLLDHTGEVEGLELVEMLLSTHGRRVIFTVVPSHLDDEDDDSV